LFCSFKKIKNRKESKMDENNEQKGFESRVLTNPVDLLAVIDHLKDNLLDSGKPLLVILTAKPRRFKETDYCSIEEPCVETILVENEEKILKINEIINEKLFMADIHVAIE